MSIMSSRICAWIVTSSAVVGSSAIRMSGSHASAIAIMTLWRMPPESSNGYWRSLFSGSLMPTRRSISSARSFAACPRRSVCSVIASISWLPTEKTGFRLVIGSWKIMEHLLPRKPAIWLSLHFVISSPLKRILPPVIEPFSARICMME